MGKGTQAGEQLKVSDICNAIYADLGELHNACRERSSRHLEFQLSREQVLVNLP